MPTTLPPDDLLSVPELLTLLKCSATTLARLRARPTFPAPYILATNHNGTPRAIGFSRKVIAQWMQAQGR